MTASSRGQFQQAFLRTSRRRATRRITARPVTVVEYLICLYLTTLLWLPGTVAETPPAVLGAGAARAVVVTIGGAVGVEGYQSSSLAAQRGLQLLAEVVNQSHIFRFKTRDIVAPLSLDARFEDYSEWKSLEQVYKSLAADPKVNFLLGPSSAAFAEDAAVPGEEAGKLVFLPGGASDGLFTRGFQNVFTTSPVSSEFARAALAVVREQGAQTVVTVWDDVAFNADLCAGAKRHAEILGMRVVESLFLDVEAVTEQIRHLQVVSPDVVLTCGQQRSAEQILISSRALNFIPKAMIISSASSRTFLRSVGAANANYVIVPVPWYPSLNFPCQVFGSSRGFKEAFKLRWGEDPSYISAEAAAAGIALLRAVEAAASLATSDVKKKLLTLKMDSFFAVNMSFFANGTRRDVSVFAEQIVPPKGGHTDKERLKRYYSSHLVPVSETSAPFYPMPSWEQKEIEIYPCDDGAVLDPRAIDNTSASLFNNYRSRNGSQCVLCPAGRYRNPRSVVCEVCEVGRYSDTAGLSSCLPCPVGADCSSSAERPGKPNATAGYYKLPRGKGDQMIWACDLPGSCLGANRCAGTRDGILCAGCVPGYVRVELGPVSGGTCMKCNTAIWNAMLIVAVVLFYILYIWVIVKATISACKSIRAIHSVLLKICVNYLQFAGTAFEATEFKEIIFAVFGTRANFLMPMITLPGVIQNPFIILSNLKCMFESVGLGIYQTCILVGLLILPTALLIKVTYAFLRKELCMQFLVPCLRRLTRKMRLRFTMRSAPAAESQCVGNDSPAPGSASSGTSGTAGKHRLRLPTSLTPKRIVTNFGLGDDFTPVTPWRVKATLSNAAATGTTKFITRVVNYSIVMGFVLYPLVIRLLVVGFECVDLDVFRQKYDLNVECASPEHMAWMRWSALGLIIYGFGAPFCLFFLLFSVRGRLFQENIRKRFGFLYNGFELRYYYFETIFMVRKVIVILFFTFPTMYVRVLLLLLASWAFVLLHLTTQPFDNRGLYCFDRLESLNLRALTMTVTARLAYDMRQHMQSGIYADIANHWIVSYALAGLPLMCHCWFIGFAAWSLFRNTVLKHLVVKQDLWPERMSWLQKWLVELEWNRNKAYYIGEDEGRPCIDTSELTDKEKEFVFSALSDTLYRYTYSGHKVYHGNIVAAVQEALQNCQRRHRRRAARLHQLYRQHASVGGFWSMVLRWQGELSLALHGPSKQELSEEEQGCWSALYACLAEMCFFLHMRSRRAMVPYPKSRTDTGTSCKATCADYEDAHAFMVEDFYDEIMLIWQDIAQGRGPACTVPEPGWGANGASHFYTNGPSFFSERSQQSLASEERRSRWQVASTHSLPQTVSVENSEVGAQEEVRSHMAEAARCSAQELQLPPESEFSDDLEAGRPLSTRRRLRFPTEEADLAHATSLQQAAALQKRCEELLENNQKLMREMDLMRREKTNHRPGEFRDNAEANGPMDSQLGLTSSGAVRVTDASGERASPPQSTKQKARLVEKLKAGVSCGLRMQRTAAPRPPLGRTAASPSMGVTPTSAVSSSVSSCICGLPPNAGTPAQLRGSPRRGTSSRALSSPPEACRREALAGDVTPTRLDLPRLVLPGVHTRLNDASGPASAPSSPMPWSGAMRPVNPDAWKISTTLSRPMQQSEQRRIHN